ARVEEQHERQAPILRAHLDDDLLQPAVDVPVDAAQLVSWDVGAVVGELQARDARPALTLADEPRDDRRQRRQPQAIQLAQQLSVEQRSLVVAQGASSRTPRTTAPTMSSAVTPLRSASNVRISRCRSAGSATARTSSYERWVRPAIRAETLPASVSACAPRGLGPDRTDSRTTSEAPRRGGGAAPTPT